MQDGSLTLVLLGIPVKSTWTDLHCAGEATRGLSPGKNTQIRFHHLLFVYSLIFSVLIFLNIILILYIYSKKIYSILDFIFLNLIVNTGCCLYLLFFHFPAAGEINLHFEALGWWVFLQVSCHCLCD